MRSSIISRLAAHRRSASLLGQSPALRLAQGRTMSFSPTNEESRLFVARTHRLGGLCGHHLPPVVQLQKNHPFCTAGIGKVNEEVSEQTEKITVTFVDKDGEETVIKVPLGMSMLEAAHENDIELEGACEGSLACSTCHVIVMDIPYYNKLEEPTDEENDMLDLAFGLTETSRLGCQVIAKPELDGIRLALPAATRNFAVDGHVPKPH